LIGIKISIGDSTAFLSFSVSVRAFYSPYKLQSILMLNKLTYKFVKIYSTCGSG